MSDVRHTAPATARSHRRPIPPPVDSRKEFIKRGLDAEDELIEVGVVIVGGGTAGLACANRLLQLLADDPETMERLGEVPVAVVEKAKTCGGHNLSGAVMRPGPLAGAVSGDDPRAVARGGLRVRRGEEGGGLPHCPTAKSSLRDPAAAAVQEPRQRGRLGLRAGALPAAPGRGGRRLHPHRDRRHAADRRGRRASSACAPATRAAARTASRSATSSPAPTSRRRRRCSPRAAGGT